MNRVAKHFQLCFYVYYIFGNSIKYCDAVGETAALSHVSLFPLFQYSVIEILVRVTAPLTPTVLFRLKLCK